MNTTPPLAEMFRRIIEHPSDGIVGLVDDLLILCREHGLQLDWQSDGCRIRSFADGSEALIEASVRSSVFRAILARLAALCNAHIPASVSPYGGQGELSIGTNPSTLFRVSFGNAPGEQWLTLRPVTASTPVLDASFDPLAVSESRTN
jgi:hypothetical protein